MLTLSLLLKTGIQNILADYATVMNGMYLKNVWLSLGNNFNHCMFFIQNKECNFHLHLLGTQDVMSL